MGLFSRIRGRSKHSGTQADTSIVFTKLLKLYDINVSVELYRKRYSATLYYSDNPDDRYADGAVKQQVELKGESALDILTKVTDMLLKAQEPSTGDIKAQSEGRNSQV